MSEEVKVVGLKVWERVALGLLLAAFASTRLAGMVGLHIAREERYSWFAFVSGKGRGALQVTFEGGPCDGQTWGVTDLPEDAPAGPEFEYRCVEGGAVATSGQEDLPGQRLEPARYRLVAPATPQSPGRADYVG
jgi:hypothetical protein